MLRVAKPTSPMSVGTWILAGVRPGDRAGRGERAAAGAAGGGTLPGRLVRRAGPARPGLPRRRSRPRVASYTAVLLSQTAVPAWNAAHEELPFIFTASSAASAGGLGMIVAPVVGGGSGPAARAYGAAVELARVAPAGAPARRWSARCSTPGRRGR